MFKNQSKRQRLFPMEVKFLWRHLTLDFIILFLFSIFLNTTLVTAKSVDCISSQSLKELENFDRNLQNSPTQKSADSALYHYEVLLNGYCYWEQWRKYVEICNEMGDLLMLKSEDKEALVYYRHGLDRGCLLYTSPSPRDLSTSRMPSSA